MGPARLSTGADQARRGQRLSSAVSTVEHPELSEKLIEQLRSIHALKRGALRMFMLAAVAAERDGDQMTEVSDLLARMHRAFTAHREQTAKHVSNLESRLQALGSRPARGQVLGMSAGAAARARLGAIGGQNHGANGRDAFVFEHLEIALLALLEQLAERCGDEATAKMARECKAQDEGMAVTIDGNWTNVLSLTLPSRGLPTATTDSPSLSTPAES